MRAAARQATRNLTRLARGSGTADGDQVMDRARLLRTTLEELGPFYIKVGQILATRPDFVPDHVREELGRLNDQATPQPFSAFSAVLEQDLGAGWRARFGSVHGERPLGSASLAQVYRAVLPDGTACVVKVQRPGADRAVLGDMRALRRVTRLVTRFMPHFNEVIGVEAMTEVLFDAMRDELDFTREASNMKAARKLARSYERISVPKVLHATPRVLVQSLADGVAINRVGDDALTPKKRKQIARQLIDFQFRSYFVTGRFHADPHPGNILVSPDGTAHIIDWGMVGRLDRGARLTMLGILLGLARNDAEAVARQWIRMGATTPWSNSTGFVQDLSRKVPLWSNATLSELNYGVALMSVLQYSSRRGIQVAPIVSIIGKSLANIEGSVRCIHPELKLSASLIQTLSGVMRDLLREETSPEQLSQHLLDFLSFTDKTAGHLQSLSRDLASRQFTLQARTNLGDPIRYGRSHR
ncbi:AarF/UbiB family protein [Streptomyces sp. NPDC005908]|uniref:ABC1 kinase family protein n=1 Tax=unclassified Streptomyces TaxID=2593676 RepID=UPI0021BDC4C1|nr:AarF/UbiB family protein [Streptomyces sp. T12]